MPLERRSIKSWGESRDLFDERIWRVPPTVILLSMAAVIVSWWFAPDDAPTGFERMAARWALEAPDSWEPALTTVMQTGSRWFALASVAVAVGLGRFRLALGLGVAGSVAWLSTAMVRGLVTAPRPTASEQLDVAMREAATGYGYPSAHAAISFALMLTLAASTRATRAVSAVTPFGGPTFSTAVLMGVAVTTGFARIYLGVHWVLDVVGGAGLGLLAGALGARVARRRRSAVSNQWI